MALVHATCVAVGACGVLLLGPSGAGKSDLALRLIDEGADLVADDQVGLEADGSNLLATPAPNLAGRLEVRGIGIVEMAWRAPVTLGLAVDLVAREPARLPESATWRHQGIEIPLVAVFARAASASAKVRVAVSAAWTDSAGLVARAQSDAEAR